MRGIFPVRCLFIEGEDFFMAQIADIIKYEGGNDVFVWKHPCEDFNSLTQLIVHESQEAIFFMNGQALDLFGPGRYTLETENIPKIGKFLNRATGGETPFHCEVYFINKTVQMSVKWGTDSKVRYIDPASGLPLELGASGEMNIQVCDGRKLLVKLVGTTNGVAWGENGINFTKSLQQSFRPLISAAVKSHLTTSIKALGINILEVDEHLLELSKNLRSEILPGFEEYGLTVPQFYLTTVVLPDDDPNFRRLKDLYAVSIQKRTIQAEAELRTVKAQTEADVTAAQRAIELEKQTTQTEVARREAERKIIAAQAEAEATRQAGFAEAQVMQAQGITKKDYVQADVQKAFAEGLGNMGSSGGSGGGSPASDMVGIMAGMKMAGMALGQMDGVFGEAAGKNNLSDSSKNVCPKCGATLPVNAKFCLECGEKIVAAPDGSIFCPECGKTVAKGKFCPECGHKFVSVCPKCGAQIPDGSKFCLECGEKL